ncbi:MAG: LemA family protein [Actinomycetota bacterium]|nr:LemA family protein [Actinomycetota bacterium]
MAVIFGILMFLIIGLVLLIALGLIYIYNRLVVLRNRIENAWAQIDVQLKRRYDLIPNLVETVKGYAAHEKELFENVTKARAEAIKSTGSVGKQAQAENMLTQTLRSLFAVAENYPELKANENFMMLQEELAGTESKIAYARQFYNDTVMKYNTMIQSLPTRLVAPAFGFSPREYFEIEEVSREPVKVQF